MQTAFNLVVFVTGYAVGMGSAFAGIALGLYLEGRERKK